MVRETPQRVREVRQPQSDLPFFLRTATLSFAGDPVTAAEVSQLIENEIASVGEDWITRPENNPHRLDLSRCLINPERVICKNTFPRFRGGKPFEAWLVLEELPNNDDGYRIIFDEEIGQFGLAEGTRRMPAFIGWHGSFLNTVRGM
jgi:hypothetical protein